MKTFIVDWGEGANGGRYALIQADCLIAAWWSADSVGAPFRIAELEIPEKDECRYMEICAPKNPYCGTSLNELKFKSSDETAP